MGVRTILLSGCLALLPVGADLHAGEIAPSDVCTQLNSHSQARHGFTNSVTRICFGAARQVARPDFPSEADFARMTLEAIQRYANALAELERPPTETGAYLIAHNVGLRGALSLWLNREELMAAAEGK